MGNKKNNYAKMLSYIYTATIAVYTIIFYTRLLLIFEINPIITPRFDRILFIYGKNNLARIFFSESAPEIGIIKYIWMKPGFKPTIEFNIVKKTRVSQSLIDP